MTVSKVTKYILIGYGIWTCKLLVVGEIASGRARVCDYVLWSVKVYRYIEVDAIQGSNQDDANTAVCLVPS